MQIDTVPALPRFVDIPTVQQRTTLGRSAIFDLMAAGKLTRLKLGRKTVVLESSLLAYMNGVIEAKS